MKKIATFILLFFISLVFMACERNDYQHPAHRSAK